MNRVIRHACTRYTYVAWLIVLLVPVAAVNAQASSETSQWYIGIAAGTGVLAKMQHADMYVGNSCNVSADCEPKPGGRWNYSLEIPYSWSLQLTGGYQMRKVRFELSAVRQSSAMRKTYMTFTPHNNASSNPLGEFYGLNHSVGRVGELNTSSAILGAYYVYRLGNGTVYLGGGLGLTKSIVTDALYDDPDSCIPGEICNNRITTIKMSGHVDLRDIGLSQHISTGLDRRISNQVSIGLKVTYSRFAEVLQNVNYEFRTDRLSAETTISGINSLSAVFNLKYSFR